MASRSARTPRLTQVDIARLAGVSQATVSLVLNGRADASTRISSATATDACVTASAITTAAGIRWRPRHVRRGG